MREDNQLLPFDLYLHILGVDRWLIPVPGREHSSAGCEGAHQTRMYVFLSLFLLQMAPV